MYRHVVCFKKGLVMLKGLYKAAWRGFSEMLIIIKHPNTIRAALYKPFFVPEIWR
jgi:GTPase